MLTSTNSNLKCEDKCDFEVGIVGSGFGGCIAGIELARVFQVWNTNHPNDRKEVCMLERGIWNLSPEAWVPGSPVAEFIHKDNRPYQFWAQPDTSRGLLSLFGMLRTIPYKTGFLKLFGHEKVNHHGLYDVKDFNETYSIVASGVGGGSLVYSGVIACPEPEIFDEEYFDKSSKPWKPRWRIRYSELEPYMMYAKYKFIEVNKIYSILSGHSDEEWMILPKTRTLRNAVNKLREEEESKQKEGKKSPFDFQFEFEFADLAMIEAPKENPGKDESKGFCKRQGRCNMGCLPGARNTLNKKLVDAINKGLPLCVKELAEVTQIEPINGGKDGYCISYLDHGVDQTDFEDRWMHFLGYRLYGPDHKIERKQRRIRVKKLILAAGTYGTTGLLLRSKQELQGSWDFSDSVGKSFSLNGDHFGFVTPTASPVYPTVGPIDTAKVRFKKKNGERLFTIEDATIPRMIASTFSSLIEAHLNIMGGDRSLHMNSTFWRYPRLALEFLIRDRNDLARFIKAMKKFIESPGWFASNEGLHAWLMGVDRHHNPGENEQKSPGEFSNPDELDDTYRISKIFFFACMGVDHANAQASWNSNTRELDVNWGILTDDPIYDDIRDGMRLLGYRMVSDETKNKPEDQWLILKPMSQLFPLKKKRLSIHPIGGCPMETQGRPGAVSCFGKLLKKDGSAYENLYIVDGSIIPTALGINPSLTISGLAFRIVDEIIRTCYDGAPVLENVVVAGNIYPVTIREFSKSPDLGLAIATVDSKKDLQNPDKPPREFDNIVYVKGPDPKNRVCKTDDLKSLPKPINVYVRIEKIEGRVAFGSIV